MSLFAWTDEPNRTKEMLVIDLYDQLRPSLMVYLAGLGLGFNESEDVIHDSFIRLFDHLASGAENRNLRGWLFRVAHNLAMDSFRNGRRIEHEREADEENSLLDMVVDLSPNPEEMSIRSQEIERLRLALNSLTQQQRSAVLLRAEELRYREIAAILGISIKRVSELIQRALVRLAGEL